MGGGGGGGGGGNSSGLSEKEIIGLIEARNNAKMTRDFDEADKIRDELRSAGVNIDERARTWSTSDGRSGEIPLGGGYARGDKKTEDGNLSWENTIYVAGLPHDVSVTTLADYFGQLGSIKKSKKNFNLGEPTVHIYKDKRTGRPKGDATISYDEVETAQAAVKWFDGATFQNQPGAKLSVSIAKRPAAERFGKGKGGGGKGGGKGW